MAGELFVRVTAIEDGAVSIGDWKSGLTPRPSPLLLERGHALCPGDEDRQKPGMVECEEIMIVSFFNPGS